MTAVTAGYNTGSTNTGITMRLLCFSVFSLFRCVLPPPCQGFFFFRETTQRLLEIKSQKKLFVQIFHVLYVSGRVCSCVCHGAVERASAELASVQTVPCRCGRLWRNGSVGDMLSLSASTAYSLCICVYQQSSHPLLLSSSPPLAAPQIASAIGRQLWL